MQVEVVIVVKKIIILILIITIIILLNTFRSPAENQANSQEYFIMTSTAYSRHPNCISDEWNDGLTATGTPIREGVVAINIDWIDDKWQVRSPLKLGQKIYIEGMGYFSVEDTGPFTEKDFHFDIWNLDVYKEDYEQAKGWGIKRIKVYVLGE